MSTQHIDLLLVFAAIISPFGWLVAYLNHRKALDWRELYRAASTSRDEALKNAAYFIKSTEYWRNEYFDLRTLIGED